MSHPGKVMIPLRPPPAIILRIEAGYGCLIGSNAPAKVLKMMNGDIKTTSPALDTILPLIGESSTSVAPSSMYSSDPPLHCGAILTSVSSAAPNVTASSSLRGFGSCCEYGEVKTSGSHSS